ncbi:hypothetical protein Tco_0294640 [Tanacetum coccineum]
MLDYCSCRYARSTKQLRFLSLAACMILSSVNLGLPPREVVSILTGGIALSSFVLSRAKLYIKFVIVAGTQKKKHYVSRVNRDQEGSSSEADVSKDQQQNACRHALKHMKEESSIINRTSVLAYNLDPPSWLDYTSTKRPSYGSTVPMIWVGQAYKIAPSYVFFESKDTSYVYDLDIAWKMFGGTSLDKGYDSCEKSVFLHGVIESYILIIFLDMLGQCLYDNMFVTCYDDCTDETRCYDDCTELSFIRFSLACNIVTLTDIIYTNGLLPWRSSI